MRRVVLFILIFSLHDLTAEDNYFSGEKYTDPGAEENTLIKNNTLRFQTVAYQYNLKSKNRTKERYIPKEIIIDSLLPKPGKQGAKSSCWAWTTAYGLLSYIYHINSNTDYEVNNRPNEAAIFNPEYVYDHYSASINCNDCLHKNKCERCYCTKKTSDILDSLLMNGCVFLKDYDKTSNLCNPGIETNELIRQAKLNQAIFQSYTAERIENRASINKDAVTIIKENIARNNPVIISIRIDSLFRLNRWNNSVIWTNIIDNKESHALICVGYNDSIRALRVLNSWGTDWQQKGYAWISYNVFRDVGYNYMCFLEKTSTQYASLDTSYIDIPENDKHILNKNKKVYEYSDFKVYKLNDDKEDKWLRIQPDNTDAYYDFHISDNTGKTIQYNDENYTVKLINGKVNAVKE